MDDNKTFFTQVQAPVESETVAESIVKLPRTWVFWENYEAKSGKLDYALSLKKILEFNDTAGANRRLLPTGESSDELDDFHSVPTTPVGAQNPVAGTSRGAQVPARGSQPLPLTPEQQQSDDKTLGEKKKRKGPDRPPKQHDLRSRSAVSTSKATLPRK